MANGPVTPEADALLENKESSNTRRARQRWWRHNLLFWVGAESPRSALEKEQVLEQFVPIMGEPLTKCGKTYQAQISPRMAAYANAIKLVVDTMLLKGVV